MASFAGFERWLERDGGAVGETRREYLAGLVEAAGGDESLIVSLCHELGLQPSEFRRLSVADRIAFAEKLLADPSHGDGDEWAVTLAGDRVRTDELSEEDRPPGEWARICNGISDDSFRNRMRRDRPGKTWRIVGSGSQRYRVHLEDLPPALRGAKRLRDEFLNRPPD